MTEAEVVALMESATSGREWDDKCDEVKRRCGNYPPFWYEAVVLSGLSHRVLNSFGASADITVQTFRVGRSRDASW